MDKTLRGNIPHIRKVGQKPLRRGSLPIAYIDGTNDGSGGDYSSELAFENRKDFPLVGDTTTLYIATDEDMMYRYDAASKSYHPLGSNDGSAYSIKKIKCKLQEG